MSDRADRDVGRQGSTLDGAHADPTTTIDRVFREAYGQAVATLTRLLGDISTAEDAVQDAFVVASKKWVEDGIPPNPAGWIVTTAKRRAIDQVRRASRGRELARATTRHAATDGSVDGWSSDEKEPMGDDRLRLIFTCCHPALKTEHQVALTLRLLGGLSVDEVARAFVVSESTMAKRLVRAKFKIKATNLAYRIPDESDLDARLGSVLSVLYLIYNAGASDLANGRPCRTEAIRLARALVELMPDVSECRGLLALMLLNESRMDARLQDGELVLLRDQDRTSWNRAMIAEGHAIVRDCIREARPGPFQLQAAIQAVHCDAAEFTDTDWPQIVELYDHLATFNASPVVRLNRAIAVSEVGGPAEGLALVDETGAALGSYAPYHAARAALLRRLGRHRDAIAASEQAVDHASSPIERRHAARQLAELREQR